jgi:hypothetical protein
MLNNVSVCETMRTRGPKNKISEKKLPIAREKEVAPEEVTPEEVTPEEVTPEEVAPDVEHEFWSHILLYSFGDFETAFGRPF